FFVWGGRLIRGRPSCSNSPFKITTRFYPATTRTKEEEITTKSRQSRKSSVAEGEAPLFSFLILYFFDNEPVVRFDLAVKTAACKV
ncbi:MAG: hypothetical protein LBL64_04065, partial [Treponema sp.]|nr:hypothetical protein [Treponema sp.]